MDPVKTCPASTWSWALKASSEVCSDTDDVEQTERVALPPLTSRRPDISPRVGPCFRVGSLAVGYLSVGLVQSFVLHLAAVALFYVLTGVIEPPKMLTSKGEVTDERVVTIQLVDDVVEPEHMLVQVPPTEMIHERSDLLAPQTEPDRVVDLPQVAQFSPQKAMDVVHVVDDASPEDDPLAQVANGVPSVQEPLVPANIREILAAERERERIEREKAAKAAEEAAKREAVAEATPPKIPQVALVDPPPTEIVEAQTPPKLEPAEQKDAPTDTTNASAQDGGVTDAPVVQNLPKPSYPALSRRMKEQGVVVLSAIVQTDGTTRDVQVVRAPDYPRLIEAARKALLKAKFVPATRNGQQIEHRVTVPFRFVLKHS